MRTVPRPRWAAASALLLGMAVGAACSSGGARRGGSAGGSGGGAAEGGDAGGGEGDPGGVGSPDGGGALGGEGEGEGEGGGAGGGPGEGEGEGEGGGVDGAPPGPVVVPEADFFTDISDASGVRVDNYIPGGIGVPINDHSRLAFADLNGDGFDDVVMHSLFPNPQAGIPFEHLVFLNNGDGTFAHASDASGLRGVKAGFFAFADVDNDGDQDVFAGLDLDRLGSARHQILLNDGQGHFTALPDSGVEGISGGAANAVFADFDGDAVVDLFIGRGGTMYGIGDALLFGVGDGRFENVSVRLQGAPNQPSNGSVTCDYDNDGDLDIFVSTYGVSVANGVNTLWENEGGRFTDVAVARGFASQAGGNYFLASTEHGAATEPGRNVDTFVGSNGFGIDCDDVNNDGLMDIFLTTISHPVDGDYLRKWSDPSQLLINQGEAAGYAFSNEFQARQLPFNEGDVDGASVDFDNDGRLDLSVSRDKKYERNYGEIDQHAWFGLMWQRADGTFASLGPASGINEVDAAVQATLDACGDDGDCATPGEACLPLDAATPRCRRACRDDAGCPAAQELCHAKGFCKLYLGMKNAQNHAWSDIDHDGDLDLLVGGRDTGGGRPNFLFRNEIGHQNRWLAFRLEGDGVAVHRDAFGARVSLVFGDETLTREKKSSRGMYNSEDTRVLHFGLGDRSADYEIRVRWPDGVEAILSSSDVSERRYVRLAYPDRLSVE